MEPVLVLCLRYLADWRKCKEISLDLVELCLVSEPDLNPALDLPGHPMTSRGECKASPGHRDLSASLVPCQVAVSSVLCNLSLSKDRSKLRPIFCFFRLFFLGVWYYYKHSNCVGSCCVFNFILFSSVPKTSTLKWLILSCLPETHCWMI